MSNSCTGSDCSNKLAEYKKHIDKLLKRLRDSENQKSEHEILNLKLKHMVNSPSKIESKHFQRIFNLIQILIDSYFGKSKKEDSIRDIFLGMIDSIWTLLDTRYTDSDTWMDLKISGTSIVESLANFELPVSLPSEIPPKDSSDDHIYETLANMKKGEEFQPEQKSDQNKINLVELNKELDFLRKQTTLMREKILEQNCVIKTMCKSFSKKLHEEQQQQSQLNTSNNTATTTTTTSSVRLSSSSMNNEASSGFFNLNSSQVYSSSSDRNQTDIGRGPLKSPLSMSKESSSNKLTCPSCKMAVDARRYSVDKFEKHVAMCRNTCANDNPNNETNNICLTQRKSSVNSSVSSTNSAGSCGNGNNNNNNTYQSQRRSSGEQKKYEVIYSFEPKPRKRL